MLESSFEGIKIAAIATAVPKNREIIKDKFSDIFGEDAVKSFSETTGVLERRVALPEQTASDLAFVAAQKIINEKAVDVEDIGVLIFVSQSPDYKVPATALVLHKRLGLKYDCIAFDVNLGCSGYIYGIQIVASLLKSTNARLGLLLIGDTGNVEIAPNDKSSRMLFGEAGSATLIENTSETKDQIYTTLKSDGSGFKAIIKPAGRMRNKNASHERVLWPIDGIERSDYDFYMDGIAVFTFTITKVPSLIKEYFKKDGVDKDSFDDFVFHQANLFVIKQLIKKCKLDEEKVPISMNKYGNTSGTSVPITLCHKYGSVSADDKKKIFACGFGVGWSWGIATFEIAPNDIFEIIETEDYYTDGGVSHE